MKRLWIGYAVAVACLGIVALSRGCRPGGGTVLNPHAESARQEGAKAIPPTGARILAGLDRAGLRSLVDPAGLRPGGSLRTLLDDRFEQALGALRAQAWDTACAGLVNYLARDGEKAEAWPALCEALLGQADSANGEPEAALGLVGSALAVADLGLEIVESTEQKARLQVARARALARTKRTVEAKRALGAARELDRGAVLGAARYPELNGLR